MKNGKLLLIGGALEPSSKERVFEKFIKLAGGNDSNIGILPTASNEMTETISRYETGFKNMGVSKITPLMITNREDSNNSKFTKILKDLDAIFLTGGDQLPHAGGPSEVASVGSRVSRSAGRRAPAS